MGWAAPNVASAAPNKVSFTADKDGVSGEGNYNWPEVVVGGNGLTLHTPLQIGAAGYLPRARFALQYARQIRRSHWAHFGIGFLADRGSFDNFRMDDCGLPDETGRCGRGSVIGYDIYGGYAYKFFLQKRPWLVPIVRGSLGFSWWKHAPVGGDAADREQGRTKSWTLNVRPGGGIRIFPKSNLGVGSDLNIPIGFLVHTDEPDGGTDRSGGFLFGFEIMPLVGEFRF